MTLAQTKQKIAEFVEKETDKHKNQICVDTTIEAALHRAIIFGLELGKEAGPEKRDKGGINSCGCDVSGGCGCAVEDFNTALSAKNAAIQELIDEVKI